MRSGHLFCSADVPTLAALSFCLLTLLHVVANIKAMRALQLQTINPYRLQILLRAFLKQVGLKGSHVQDLSCLPGNGSLRTCNIDEHVHCHGVSATK